MPPASILMCPPDHYGIEYEINPWMNRSLGAVRELAFRQWQQPPRHARVARRAGRDDDAAAGAARPGVHRQRRARVPRHVPQQPVPPRGPGHASRRTSTPGSPTTASRSSTCRRTCSTRGPATPCSAATRCSPATARGPTCTAHQWVGEAARRPRAAAGAGQPALLPPRHLLLPARARRGDLLPRRVRRLRPAGADDARPEADRGRARRRRTGSAATRWWSARRWFTTAAARSWRRTWRGAGYRPIEVELDEFLKAGGSAKCLTLRLDGEEAAAWKEQR